MFWNVSQSKWGRKEARKEEIEEEGRLFDGRFANGGERQREREISDGLTVFGYFFTLYFLQNGCHLRAQCFSLSPYEEEESARASACVCVWDSETLFDSHAHISREKREKRDVIK